MVSVPLVKLAASVKDTCSVLLEAKPAMSMRAHLTKPPEAMSAMLP
jgi:hypothetical protein